MRVIVVGLGVQGHKRRAHAGDAVAAVVDPFNEEAAYRHVADVPLNAYDAALVCTPDAAKGEVLTYLLDQCKHVLVEKPMLSAHDCDLGALRDLAARRGVTCYTAYNHRFEPHFVRMHDLLASGDLGTLYSLRMFYGNGTARLVRDSAWRDQGAGVLPDLGSHLLDTCLFWLGDPVGTWRLSAARCFENRAPDFCSLQLDGPIAVQLEMTLLSWRNDFAADVLAEKGSAHIRSLCKWGPSSFTRRTRILPSGRPDEDTVTLVQPDPTWAHEYAHFQALCRAGDPGNLATDLVIDDILTRMAAAAGGGV